LNTPEKGSGGANNNRTTLKDKLYEILPRVNPSIREFTKEILNKLEVNVRDSPPTIAFEGVTKVIEEINPNYIKRTIESLLPEGYQTVLGDNLPNIAYQLASIIYEELEKEEREIGLEIEEPEKVSPHELFREIVDTVLAKYTIKTFYKTETEKEIELGVFRYDNGVYIPCEKFLESEIQKLVNATQNNKLREKTTRWVIEEAIATIKRSTPKEYEEESLKIAFKNYILDWNLLLNENKSIFESMLKPSPELIVFHRIPHNLNTEALELIRKDIDKESLTVNDIEQIASKLCPKTLEAFKTWIGRDWLVLFETIGFTLYPNNDLKKAIMIIGPPDSGKSTYLRFIIMILGEHNITAIKLQDLSDSGGKYLRATLYHKLANIRADLPTEIITGTGAFKELTGEDYILVERKYKDPFLFKSYAKPIFSANQLPIVAVKNEDLEAFWNRWVIIEFKNQITNKIPDFELTLKEEIENVIIVSILAFKEVWKKRTFYNQKSSEYYKELWQKNSDSVYAFIQDLLNDKEDRIPIRDLSGIEYIGVKDPEGKIETQKLYELYAQYCRITDREDIVNKNTFTQRLERLPQVSITKIMLHGYPYYKGIRLIPKKEQENPFQ